MFFESRGAVADVDLRARTNAAVPLDPSVPRNESAAAQRGVQIKEYNSYPARPAGFPIIERRPR